MPDYRRLLHKRVKELIEEDYSDNSVTLLSRLSKSYPEYGRKKRNLLLKEIETCLRNIQLHQIKTVVPNEPIKEPCVDKLNTKKRKLQSTEKTSDKATKRKLNRARLVRKCPTTRLASLGGIDSLLNTIKKNCEFPLKQRELYRHLGVKPLTGVLIVGSTGCGKTALAHAIAGEMQVPFFSISAPEIISAMSGESEEKLRDLFDLATQYSPSILFLDELDSICPRRESSNKGMEKRVVAQLIGCLDNLSTSNERNQGVLVIGATSNPDLIDPALRQTNRFDREILIPIPDAKARVKILQTLCKDMKIDTAINFDLIAKHTPGFVGADLAAVCKEAASTAIERRLSNQDDIDMEQFLINSSDFNKAIRNVQPSAKREGFAVVPKVSWDEIGALEHVKLELELAITQPIMEPEKFERFNLSIGGGVLLYGPPGCGKTLVAKAVANQSQANFISVKGPELMNKFVGESEKGVRNVFARARASSPCVIFFDEIDSLCPKRSLSSEGSGVSERVVNQLLTEMDGVEERKSVFIIAATNRPDIIDTALLRPGRLNKKIFIPLPDVQGKADILGKLINSLPVSNSLTLEFINQIARSSELNGFSGADINAMVREAKFLAIKNKSEFLDAEHLKQAASMISPSVTESSYYSEFNQGLSSTK